MPLSSNHASPLLGYFQKALDEIGYLITELEAAGTVVDNLLTMQTNLTTYVTQLKAYDSTTLDLPNAVADLAGGTATSTSMPLTWTPDPGYIVTGWKVYFKIHTDPTYTLFGTFAVPALAAKTVTGLTTSTSYDFKVAGTSANGDGAISNIVTKSTA